jgi:AcrR family transcriptional regulator
MPTRKTSAPRPATASRGPQQRSRERFEARLQDVVSTAAAVFARQGFSATTVDDLMAATGLQRGGLYHYMTRKEDLLVAIHERLIVPLLAEAERIDVEPLEPAEAVRRHAHALAHSLRDYHDEVIVFLNEWRLIRDHPAWAQIRRARRDLEHVIERSLRRGVARGDFAIPDTRLATLALLGMFNHAHQWFDPAGRISAEALADRFADIFLQGIRGRG